MMLSPVFVQANNAGVRVTGRKKSFKKNGRKYHAIHSGNSANFLGNLSKQIIVSLCVDLSCRKFLVA